MQNNKLNIGIIGYGKMGKIIEETALAKGHEIGLKTNSDNPLEHQTSILDSIDVAIEFTSPSIAPENLKLLAAHKIPTVCGSTAWLDQYDDIINRFQSTDTPFIYASNFSIGVNIFFQINGLLAKLMNHQNQYAPSIYESHHTEKKDAPSGTAVSIAEQMIQGIDRKLSWSMHADQIEESINIKADRIADVKGYHEVNYISEIDKISISHEAYSREGFAQGAVLSAEWIIGKKGIFGFQDVLGI